MSVVAFGNPLVDMSVVLSDCSVLAKYNLQPDSQKEVNNDEFNSILHFLKRDGVNISQSPGGCAQNTVRIIQHLLNRPKVCVFFGGLGDDEFGKYLEEEVGKSGVDTRYAKHEGMPTGKVAALINGENRCLIANLGAANIYKMEHIMCKDNIDLFKETAIIYIEGFFVTHSYDVALEVISLGQKKGATVVFNICGSYVAQYYPEELKPMVLSADVILGNASEFGALAKIMGLSYLSIEDLAKNVHHEILRLRSVQQNTDQVAKITIVITQGKKPVVVVDNENTFNFPVPELDQSLVKDATGAGDAFAAGFIVGLLKKETCLESIKFGCKVAQVVVQQVGVKLPNGFCASDSQFVTS